MSEENVAVVLRVIAAINRRDADAALLELHEDAEYIDHRAAGHEEFQGHEAFREHFSETWRTGAKVHIDSETVAHPDDIVILRQTISTTDPASRPTKAVRWVTRALRDGLISRVEVFDSRQDALEAAGLEG